MTDPSWSPALRSLIDDDAARDPRLLDVRVLVVEDDPASAKLLCVLLAREGCQIRVARSAEEALLSLRVFPPRVLLLDLVLPRMSGLLLLQRLKADAATRDIVVIAATSVDDDDVTRLTREAGAVATLHKPLDGDALVRAVRNHLTSAPGEPG